jgi:hypothetical protein
MWRITVCSVQYYRARCGENKWLKRRAAIRQSQVLNSAWKLTGAFFDCAKFDEEKLEAELIGRLEFNCIRLTCEIKVKEPSRTQYC